MNNTKPTILIASKEQGLERLPIYESAVYDFGCIQNQWILYD